MHKRTFVGSVQFIFQALLWKVGLSNVQFIIFKMTWLAAN